MKTAKIEIDHKEARVIVEALEHRLDQHLPGKGSGIEVHIRDLIGRYRVLGERLQK